MDHSKLSYRPPSFVTRSTLAATLLFACVTQSTTAHADAQCVQLLDVASVKSDGTQAGNAFEPVVSADGNVIAFPSLDEFDDRFDTLGRKLIYAHDRRTGETQLVTLSHEGLPPSGNGTEAQNPSISGNGRYIAFEDRSADLVEHDVNTQFDIFVRDLQEQTIVLASRRSGDWTTPNSQPGGHASGPKLSWDGRRVAFFSKADYIDGGPAGAYERAFVRDLDTSTTTMIGVNESGQPFPRGSHPLEMAGNGRYVLFSANVQIPGGTLESRYYRRDLEANTTVRIGDPSGASPRTPSLSADGQMAIYDTESGLEIHRLDTGQVSSVGLADCETSHCQVMLNKHRISATEVGSEDGRFVLIHHHDGGQQVLKLYDLQRNEIEIVSRSADGSVLAQVNWGHFMNADATQVVFTTPTTLSSIDQIIARDVYVRHFPAEWGTSASYADGDLVSHFSDVGNGVASYPPPPGTPILDAPLFKASMNHTSEDNFAPHRAASLWQAVVECDAAPGQPLWTSPETYAIGDEVFFDGVGYRCLQAHTSQAHWTPSAVPALWQEL